MPLAECAAKIHNFHQCRADWLSEYAKPAKCDFLVGQLEPQIVIVQRKIIFQANAMLAEGISFLVRTKSSGAFLFGGETTFLIQ